jgi:hypothetical protein
LFKEIKTNTPSLLGKQKAKRKENKHPSTSVGALVNTPRKKQVSCKKGGKNKLDSQPSIFAIIGHLTLTLLLSSDFGTLKFLLQNCPKT